MYIIWGNYYLFSDLYTVYDRRPYALVVGNFKKRSLNGNIGTDGLS